MRQESIRLPLACGRRCLWLAASLALLLSLLFAGSAQAGYQLSAHFLPRHPHPRPLSGIYDSCVMPNGGMGAPYSCEERLQQLHRAGFGLVLNYNTHSMSVADNLAYADLAEENGMKVAWNLASYNQPLESKLELVRATRGDRATWGYYIGDEIHPEDRAQAEQLAEAIRALTNRPLLYVSRPQRNQLHPFKGVADFVGPDPYPVGPFDPPVCPTARWASRMVEDQLAMVLQAFSWSVDFPQIEHPWPTAIRMRRMRNAAIRCGQPKLLLWFCFHCITHYHPNPESYWPKVAWAANGVRLPASWKLD